MAQFRSLIEYSQPSAADMGGYVAPEIFGVTQFPARPAAGDAVTVRVMADVYDSMVGYKIDKVELSYWTAGEKPQTVEMKLEDAAQGIYKAELPAAAAGEEIFYTVRATDDWGNVAVEIAPNDSWTTLVEDPQDEAIDPAMDYRAIAASYLSDGELRLCGALQDKPKRVLGGTDIPAYGIIIFKRDVRYKPSMTETEVGTGMMAAYLPYLSVADMVPGDQLLSLLDPNAKHAKVADFKKMGSRLCFTFPPEVVRDDYTMGLKLVGITLAASLDPFALKPTDSTRVVMLYPTVHSFMAN